MKFQCYFCQKETVKHNNYYGCLHSDKKRGHRHVRHFYTQDSTGKPELMEVLWTFKYKRLTYEMVYWFVPRVFSNLYVCKPKSYRKIISYFPFTPNWTPDNCKEKLSKVLAFA
jgi:hypothetical protein